MASGLEEVTLRPCGKKWEVANDYIFLSYTIPRGFKTDLASIPRILWCIFPPFGRYTTPAVIHDYLTSINLNKSERDMIFRELCINNKVPVWKAAVFYYTLIFFGK